MLKSNLTLLTLSLTLQGETCLATSINHNSHPLVYERWTEEQRRKISVEQEPQEIILQLPKDSHGRHNSHPILYERWVEKQTRLLQQRAKPEENSRRDTEKCYQKRPSNDSPEAKADRLISLKVDLKDRQETSSLSQQAIALYKQQEEILARKIDPLTSSVEYLEKLGEKEFMNLYNNYIDFQTDELQRVLTLRSLSQVYKKIADVYKMDGLIQLADSYYIRAAKVLIQDLYQFDDKSYLRTSMRLAALKLKETSTYSKATKPLLSWALTTFKNKKDQIMANKILDILLVTEVESVPVSALYHAAYWSHLYGDNDLANLYITYAPMKMSDTPNPLKDTNVTVRERIANRIALDALNSLLYGYQDLVSSWNELLDDQRFHLSDIKRLDTIFGAINAEDLKDGESLYKILCQIYVSHSSF